MTPSAQAAGGRRVTRWSREQIVEKILEWEARYGEPPCSADWNPSLARWRAQDWRAERYRVGVWPSTNAAKRPFGGSFDAAIRAAGLEPHRPGPRRAAGAARPDVAQRDPAPPRAVHDALLEADARVRAAEDRAEAAERRAERAEAGIGEARRRARRAADAAGRARRTRDRVRVAERERRRIADRQAEDVAADADARVRAADDQAEAATRDAAAARAAARRVELRAADAQARADAAARLEALARAELAAAGDGAAWRAAGAAEERAAAAERRARELAALVCGEPRRLTPAELGALRDGGPSGPTTLAAALRGLARARANGGGALLAAALTEVASAAVRWRDRL